MGPNMRLRSGRSIMNTSLQGTEWGSQIIGFASNLCSCSTMKQEMSGHTCLEPSHLCGSVSTSFGSWASHKSRWHIKPAQYPRPNALSQIILELWDNLNIWEAARFTKTLNRSSDSRSL